MDPYGTPHPAYDPSKPRFRVYVDRVDSGDEPDWRHKLRFIDRMYQDSDGYPVEAVAAGDSWPEAYATAGHFIAAALTSDRCVF